jgi:hypothetical protein
MLERIEARLRRMDDETMAAFLRLLEYHGAAEPVQPIRDEEVADDAFEVLVGSFDHPNAPPDMSTQHDRYAGEALAEELASER